MQSNKHSLTNFNLRMRSHTKLGQSCTNFLKIIRSYTILDKSKRSYTKFTKRLTSSLPFQTVSSQFRQSNATAEAPPNSIEWARFRETTVTDSKLDVLDWWWTHRRKIPFTTGLERWYYCLPASST